MSELVIEICELYESGLGVKSIAKKVNLPIEMINKVIETYYYEEIEE